MKKFILCVIQVLLAMGTNICLAQDVIVKKDGSTILSKVLEVNANDIKYKKYSNLNGPTYTISVKELISINYENGERDSFASSNPQTDKAAEIELKGMSDASLQNNNEKIRSYNKYSVKYVSDKVGRAAKRAFFTLAYSDNSVILNEELSCKVSIGQIHLGNARGASGQVSFSKAFTKGLSYYYFINQALQITLTNNTSNTIYIDLANSFYRRGEEASPYFVPQASSSMQSSTIGAGIGIPTFFGAIGLGTSQTHAVTITTYTQRIIAIPPHSSKSLEPEMLFPKDYQGTEGLSVDFTSSRGGYYPIINIGKEKFNNGDVMTFTHENSPIKIGAYITYGMDESLTTKEHLSVDLYAREMVGFPYPTGAAAFCANAEKYIEIAGDPLSFITVINDGFGSNGTMILPK